MPPSVGPWLGHPCDVNHPWQFHFVDSNPHGLNGPHGHISPPPLSTVCRLGEVGGDCCRRSGVANETSDGGVAGVLPSGSCSEHHWLPRVQYTGKQGVPRHEGGFWQGDIV